MDYFSEGLAKTVALLLALDPETFSAVWATGGVTALALAASLALGLPLGFCLGYFRFPGRRAARFVVDWMLSLPTVVIGLIVYALLTTRRGAGRLGPAVHRLRHGHWPDAAGPAHRHLHDRPGRGIHRRPAHRDAALPGANRRQMLLATLSEARFAMALAAAQAFGRIVSEVGIAMMVGGNIKWSTRTITTAIALETSKGEFAQGIALSIVLMLVALLVNLLVGLLRGYAGNGQGMWRERAVELHDISMAGMGRPARCAWSRWRSPCGGVVGLYGHNGSGKSTLLRLLGFLLEPLAERMSS